MKKIVSLLVALLCMVAAVGYAETAPMIPKENYPIVDGSTATLPLSYALMQYATGVSEEQAKETIRHSKTTRSLYELVNGNSDLLLVGQPSDDAFGYAKECGVELLVKPVARDALVFLINEKNPVESLTDAEIKDIYRGKVRNWKEVGGEDSGIIAYQRNEESGSQIAMINQVMKGVKMTKPPMDQQIDEMEGLIDVIASYKNEANSIGYSVYYYVNNMYMQSGIKLLSVGGVAPTNETIASAEYPYLLEYFAVIRADAPEDSYARMLYDFLTTDEGAKLVEGAGYVPLRAGD